MRILHITEAVAGASGVATFVRKSETQGQTFCLKFALDFRC